MGHSLNVSAGRRFSPKWSVAAGTSASYLSLDQMLFTQPLLGRTAALPASFDDLANTLLTSTFTTEHLAAMLTGSSIVESPSRLLFLGNRMFTSEVSLSTTYASSTRTSVTLSAHAVRLQPMSPGRSDTTVNNDLLPKSTTGMVDLVLAHWFDPRTCGGVSIDTSRSISQLQDTYITSASAFHRAENGNAMVCPVAWRANYVTSGLSKIRAAAWHSVHGWRESWI